MTSNDGAFPLGNRMLIYASRLEKYGVITTTELLRFKSARKSKPLA